MDKIKNSISSFSVRTLPRSNKHYRNIGCLHRKAHLGLSSSQFMPNCDVDLMAFYVQRKIGSHSKQAPEDILQLIEQLTNVEEKVKAMEEKLGGGGHRHRHLNVMSVKENNIDGHSSDHRRKKVSRKRRKGARCLCFPWSYKHDKSDKEDKKKNSKSEAKSHGKKDVKEEHKNVGRGSRVSWDEGITVRYIGDESSTDLLKKSSRKNKVVRRKWNSEDSLEESPAEDDVKNVVHVKIRIPKDKKQSSSNIIEITGQNIEDDEDIFEVVKTLKDAPPLKEMVEEESAEYSLQPPVTSMTADTRTVKLYESPAEPKQVPGKTEENAITAGDDLQSDDVDVVNSIEMRDSLKPLGSSEDSDKIDPKISVERDILSYDTKRSSEHNIDFVPKNRNKNKLSKSGITAETKKTNSRRSSMTKNDELTTKEREEFENAEENVQCDFSPIAMIEHSQKISEPAIVGIPIKESGRRSCGSQGCKCKGSHRNDSNLSELKKSLNMNESETSLLDKMVGTSPEPEEMTVPTGLGVVNVVTHPHDCVCIVCETFGSRQESCKRNSIRSETGTSISKRVIRVRYNEDYRHVLTHTEECGCAICIGIDEEMRKYKSRRSTQMSTRDSVLFVKDKGLCGCTNCKTVTTFKRDSEEMEQYNRDMEQQIKDYEAEISVNVPESMTSRSSYRTIDPCYYSQATVPSMNSFPLKHLISYDDRIESCPSIDSLESSEEEIIHPKNNRKYKEIIVNPKTKRVSLKRDDRDTNKSIIIISAKQFDEPEGLKESHFTEKSHRKKRRYGFTNRSPEKEYGIVTEWQYKHSNNQDMTNGTYKSQKPKNKRIKVWRDRSNDEERERVDDTNDLKRQRDDSRGKKSRKVYKRTDRSEQRSKKHPKENGVVTQAVEMSDPQTTLEEIIKDLVSGRSDESEDKTYTVTLGKIHDKPYTKVRIMDCSKPHIESSSSLFSTDTLQCPSTEKDGSDSAVFFSKTIPSISVSPTCSSNFARSGETSVVNISHSLVTNNHCHVSDSAPLTCSQSVSPSPSLLIISSVTSDDVGNEDRKSKYVTESQPIPTKIVPTPTIVPTMIQEISNQKTRQRPKNSKFKIKLGGKVRSFFKRIERKKMTPVTTVNNEIQ